VPLLVYIPFVSVFFSAFFDSCLFIWICRTFIGGCRRARHSRRPRGAQGVDQRERRNGGQEGRGHSIERNDKY